MIILFVCHFQRFYRYHARLADTPRPAVEKNDFPLASEEVEVVPVRHNKMTTGQRYLYTIKKCWLQCFNVFYTLFITLAVFPNAMSSTLIPPSFSYQAILILSHPWTMDRMTVNFFLSTHFVIFQTALLFSAERFSSEWIWRLAIAVNL
jgi:hypothetical protein